MIETGGVVHFHDCFAGVHLMNKIIPNHSPLELETQTFANKSLLL